LTEQTDRLVGRRVRIDFEDVFDTVVEGTVERRLSLPTKHRPKIVYLVELTTPKSYPASLVAPFLKRKWRWLGIGGRGVDLEKFLFETIPAAIERRGPMQTGTGVEILRVKKRRVRDDTALKGSDFESFLLGSLTLLSDSQESD